MLDPILIEIAEELEQDLEGPPEYMPVEMVAQSCPACGADNLPLGSLGRLLHYNCRACGLWFHAPNPELDG